MNSIRYLLPCLALLALAFTASPASAQVSISLDIAPPALVVDDQPPIPADGYIWTPGYWAYDPDQAAYYWVPGSWEQPPQVGLLWTPGYWGWADNGYVYNAGYWGPTIGFYGGVNYGHGYWGNGYGGGRWNNGHFNYNTAANNVSNVHVAGTYSDRAAVHSGGSRVSYNGGHGGLTAQPNAEQRTAMAASHTPPTAQQQQRFQTAMQSRSHETKVNAHNNATAANHPAQPGAQPNAAPHDAQQFTGENGQAHRENAAANNPVEHQPQGASAFTGENAQAQKHEAEANAAQHQPQVAPNNTQPKPEEKTNPVAEQHQAEVKKEHATQAPAEQHPATAEQHQAAPVQQHIAQPEQHQQVTEHQAEQHQAAPMQHSAPAESHPAGPAVHEGAPAVSHAAQAAPHAAGPAAAPQAKAQGGPAPQGKGPNQP